MTKGLIFDYGGTLDTGGCHWGMVLWHAYERNGVPVSEELFRNAYVYGERTLATNRIIMPNSTFRDTLSEKIRLQLEWLEDNGALNKAMMYHGAILDDVYSLAKHTTEESVKVLKTLAENHPIVLVSNFYGNINTVLKEFSFDGIFKDIIESAVVGIRKPDPRIFELGVEHLAMQPEEVTIVGDSYTKDIVPAHAIGCRTVWIKGEGWTEEKIENPVSDEIISNLTELIK